MSKEWKKAGSGPEKTWLYKEQKEIIGIYTSMRDHIGPNDSNMYILTVGDEEIGVWGTTLLNKRFQGIKLGEEVKIIYLGMGKSPKSGREYHNFELYHRIPEGISELPTVDADKEIDPEKDIPY